MAANSSSVFGFVRKRQAGTEEVQAVVVALQDVLDVTMPVRASIIIETAAGGQTRTETVSLQPPIALNAEEGWYFDLRLAEGRRLAAPLIRLQEGEQLIGGLPAEPAGRHRDGQPCLLQRQPAPAPAPGHGPRLQRLVSSSGFLVKFLLARTVTSTLRALRCVFYVSCKT